MAHFAVLDENNIVTAVNVIADADCLDGETESIRIEAALIGHILLADVNTSQ